LPRPDAHYLVFFVRAGNARFNAFYEKFFNLTGTPEAVARPTVEYWVRRGSSAAPWPEAPPHEVRPLAAADEALVARAAERSLGPMAARALSLVPGELTLPDTASRFAELGLERR